MDISCHLSFDGNCQTAFRTYQDILGGELATLLTFGQSPLSKQVPEDWQRRILHVTLAIDGQELLGSDAFPNTFAKPQGFSVTLNISDIDRARTIFDRFSEDGVVQMAFQSTFWTKGFGVVTDKFGVTWEVNCKQSPDSQI